jgi:ribosomal protein L9
MNKIDTKIVEDAATLAVEKTTEAQEAIEASRMAQLILASETAEKANSKAEELIKKAEDVARKLLDLNAHSDDKIAKYLAVALKDVFGEHEHSGRFIDTNRIPLICQDIKGIHTEVSGIKDDLKWIVRLIIGTVVTALLALVLIK